MLDLSISHFQIKESPEGDWNLQVHESGWRLIGTFKLKNPRKGTETLFHFLLAKKIKSNFQIKESPEGDWNF